MRIMVLGSDGYIGHSLALDLLKQGHEVFMGDNYSRRQRVKDEGSDSLTPILSAVHRRNWIRATYGYKVEFDTLSLGNDHPMRIRSILSGFAPEAIVHLAEQPSAPWSMKTPFHAHMTQADNIIGTLHLLWAMKEECPNAHLIKLGTMGEYGTPTIDIPEGTIPNQPCTWLKVNSVQELHQEEDKVIRLKRKCPMSGLLFPRQPGSWYHLSKVHDTYNIDFACRNWGLRSTDIMQGVVFGLNNFEHDSEITRFDYDECFGTVINRFCVQALIDMPLTIYGEGGQTRGFLPLKDSVACLNIAINNSPKAGQYRTFNQFGKICTINWLADQVIKAGEQLGLAIDAQPIPNPRLEAEHHYYNPSNESLINLGYEPTEDFVNEIVQLLNNLTPYKGRIIKEVIMPKTNWRR